MIEKVVKRFHLKNDLQLKDDMASWLKRTTQERPDIVEQLRLESGNFSMGTQRLSENGYGY